MAGTLIVRPDSGDPPTVVVKVLNILGRKHVELDVSLCLSY